jgi:hypothetical protein
MKVGLGRTMNASGKEARAAIGDLCEGVYLVSGRRLKHATACLQRGLKILRSLRMIWLASVRSPRAPRDLNRGARRTNRLRRLDEQVRVFLTGLATLIAEDILSQDKTTGHPALTKSDQERGDMNQ